MNKDVIVFYLKRHLRDLEEKVGPLDQEELARRGVSYAARQDAVEARDKAADALRTEIEAFREAIRLVEESPSLRSSR